MASRFDWPAVVRLSAAHLVNDVNQSAVLGLLPFIVAERGLSYVVASGLAAALTASSAIVQPVLGHLADRRPSRAWVPATLVVGAVGVACLGTLATTLGIAVMVLAIGGATAAFHPEALRRLGTSCGGRRTTALAVFAVGGNLGTAIGPMVAAALVTAVGMRGMAVLVVPSLIVAALGTAQRAVAPARRAVAAGPVRWASFACLLGVLFARSALSALLVTFVPLYLVRHAGLTPGQAGVRVTVMLLAGVAASPLAGLLAERFGGRAVLTSALAPLGPLLVLFVACDALRVPCLVLIGAGTMATYSVAVEGAQRCLPAREGFAGGIAMGVGSFGAVLLLGFGALADRAGLPVTINVAAALPVIAAALAFTAFGQDRVSRG